MKLRDMSLQPNNSITSAVHGFVLRLQTVIERFEVNMSFLRVYVADALVQEMALPQQRLTIGRGSDNGLVLNNSGVSRLHAVIDFEDGDYFVQDNESSNGVFVNKQKVQRQKLKFHDEIQIHNYVLKFMRSAGIHQKEQLNDAAAQVEEEKTVFNAVTSSAELEALRNKPLNAKPSEYC